MVDPQKIIPLAATILRDLASKPREQIQFTPDGIRILETLRNMQMVTVKSMSSLPEQNIWTISDHGLKWLQAHGISP